MSSNQIMDIDPLEAVEAIIDKGQQKPSRKIILQKARRKKSSRESKEIPILPFEPIPNNVTSVSDKQGSASGQQDDQQLTINFLLRDAVSKDHNYAFGSNLQFESSATQTLIINRLEYLEVEKLKFQHKAYCQTQTISELKRENSKLKAENQLLLDAIKKTPKFQSEMFKQKEMLKKKETDDMKVCKFKVSKQVLDEASGTVKSIKDEEVFHMTGKSNIDKNEFKRNRKKDGNNSKKRKTWGNEQESLNIDDLEDSDTESEESDEMGHDLESHDLLQISMDSTKVNFIIT